MSNACSALQCKFEITTNGQCMLDDAFARALQKAPQQLTQA